MDYLLALGTALASCAMASGEENVLNPDNYQPGVFSVGTLVSAQHTGNPFRSTNVISVPGTDNWGDYWYGLIIVPIIFIVLLLFFFFYFCFQSCCRCQHRKDSKWRMCGFVFFVLCTMASIILWGMVISVNNELDAASGSVVSSMQVLTDQADKFIPTLQNASTVLTQGADLTDSAITSCQALGNQTLIDQLQDIKSQLQQAAVELQDAESDLPDTSSVNDDVQNYKKQFDQYGNTVILAFSIMMVVICSFFMLATMFEYLTDEHARCCAGLRVCLQRSSCILIFTIGLFCVTICVICAAVLQPVSTVNADICSPNVDQNIQRLLAEGNKVQEISVSNASGSFCKPMADSKYTARNHIGEVLCYYQVCAGDNDLEEGLQKFQDALYEITNTTVPPTWTQCGSDVNGLVTYGQDQLTGLFDQLILVFSCATINPIYQSVVHDSLCTALPSPFVYIWKYFISASLLLLFAFGFYLHFNLRYSKDYSFQPVVYEETHLVEQTTEPVATAAVVSEEDAVKYHETTGTSLSGTGSTPTTLV